jgi:hypothetical protein
LIGQPFHKKFEGMNVNKITQLLASVDEEDRDKALLTLRTFVSGKETLSKVDFQKLWKGIYYCLFCSFHTVKKVTGWQTDKNIKIQQERLSQKLFII